MTIWKFPLQVLDYQTISVPRGAEILTVQVQNGLPCVWAKVTAAADLTEREIVIFGTRHPLPDWPLKYIGTFQVSGGALVFHVFERIV